MAAAPARESNPVLAFGRRGMVALVAAAVGTVAGLGAIAFRSAFAGLQTLGFGGELKDGIEIVRLMPGWLLLLLPAAGGLIVGLVTLYLLPQRRPQSVADVIESSALRGGAMNLRTGLIAAAASAVSIGTGASVGREGPMVHLGATLGAWITRRLMLPQQLARRMLACGAAAGVAASFNAPIAGAIFAAEVVVGRYTLYTFAPIAIASIAGTIVSRLYYGDFLEFDVPVLTIASYAEIPSFVGLGILCALASIALIRLIGWVSQAWTVSGVPLALRPAIAGFGLGALALLCPQVLGVGYETTSLAVAGQLSLLVAVGLALAKLAATALCLGSSFSGGIFSPSLMIGSLLGCAWGHAMNLAFPEIASAASAYALVGMGAVAAATLGAPLSTTLIVFELTGNYPVTLAVMLAAVLSSVAVNELWGNSFFTWQLAARGVDPRVRRTDALLAEATLASLATSGHPTVASQEPIGTWLQRESREALVIDGDRRLIGRVLRPQAEQALRAGRVTTDEAVGSIAESIATLAPEESLTDGLQVLREAQTDGIALIDEAGRLCGFVAADQLVRRYHELLDRAYAEEHGGFLGPR